MDATSDQTLEQWQKKLSFLPYNRELDLRFGDLKLAIEGSWLDVRIAETAGKA